MGIPLESEVATQKVASPEPVLPTTGRRDSSTRSRSTSSRSARQSGRLATDLSLIHI